MQSARYSCQTFKKLEISTTFSKNSQTPNLMIISLVGSEFFHAVGRAGRQADRPKLVVAIHNFTNPPKTH
jgi:hypothetical protein